MWIQIESTEKALKELENYIEYSADIFSTSYLDIRKSIENIGNYIPEAEKKNPGLTNQLLNSMW